MEDKNKWHFVELEDRVGTDEDEADGERHMSPLQSPGALRWAKFEQLLLSSVRAKAMKKVATWLSSLGCQQLNRVKHWLHSVSNWCKTLAHKVFAEADS